jgi:hypothetical protein
MTYEKIEELVEEHMENKGMRKRDGKSHSSQKLWTSSRNGTQMTMPTPVGFQHGEHVLTDYGKLLCIPTAPQSSQCQHLGNGSVAPFKTIKWKGHIYTPDHLALQQSLPHRSKQQRQMCRWGQAAVRAAPAGVAA